MWYEYVFRYVYRWVRHLYYNNNCKTYFANKASFAFHKVVWRHIQVRWASLQFYYVKFPQDSDHQKLLKLVNFSPSYSEYKGGKQMLKNGSWAPDPVHVQL